MDIYQHEIPALLAPFAEQQGYGPERVHVLAGYLRHRAGFVLSVDETEVVKADEMSRSHIPLASIDRIVIANIDGKPLREYNVIRDELDALSQTRSTYGMA